MQITKRWLQAKGACKEGTEFFESQKETDAVKLIKKYKSMYPEWCNWLIVRVMTYKQYVSYAVFSAEQVIDIYEKQYPNDSRLRYAIEFVKKCIDDPSNENKQQAADAADAAYAYAAYAYAAAKKRIQQKILNYGLKLLCK